MRNEGPVSTLQELHRTSCWCGSICTNSACLRRSPIAIVPLIIWWGPQVSSNRLRHSARCARCGHKGVNLQHPSWRGSAIGWEAFPCVPIRLSQQLRASPLDPRGKERCIYESDCRGLGHQSDKRLQILWDEEPSTLGRAPAAGAEGRQIAVHQDLIRATGITIMAMPSITATYLGLLALLYVFLSLQVSRMRRGNKIAFGDGENLRLRSAIRAHAHFAEYVPIIVRVPPQCRCMPCWGH